MNHCRVLIIGAGPSGIAAASRLLERGFTDFKILEAESRIGGRVYTRNLGDIPIELGAEWIHGEHDNVVFELASKNGFTNTDVDSSVFMHTNFYDSAGQKINKDISIALMNIYNKIIYSDTKDLSNKELCGSLGSFFDKEYDKELNELRKSLNIDTKLSRKFLKFFELWENSIDASNSWYETSLKGHMEYWECDGNPLVQWKNNRYDTLFGLLTKKIPDPKKQLPIDDRIIFNKEVVKINWNKDCENKLHNVNIECLDGSVYSSDTVLLTCSLGVLKERASEMFSPSLPTQKLKCIENLGFGTVDKIFVKFSHSWWGDDFDGYGFLWSEEERKCDTSNWLNGIIAFHPINKKCSIMRGWITGETAEVMETLSDEEVVEGINHLFNKFLGPTLDISPIEVCVTSKWHSNPHFRGSYSCRYLKSEEADVWASQLAESVCDDKGQPVLFFGGEGSHEHYFSTVHGAVAAGQREAEKLLQTVTNEPSKYQVAIIGAGISGLAAAKTLLENGVSDLIILEAQPQPGGRISSIQIEDYHLELGAQWIHGDKNKVFNICQENDLVTDEYSSEGEGFYFRENGEQIDETLVKDVDDIIKTILENCESYITSQEKISQSIGDELLIKFNEYLKSCTGDSEEVKKIKKELFGWHVRYQLIDNSCSDLFNLSAKAWGLFKFCGGNDYVNFKKGYSTLINTLIKSLPENVLRFQTPVERIDWCEEIKTSQPNSGEDYNVKITTKNGTTIHSRFVIVTSSLGYLKRNYKNMFYPPLPKYLSEPIDYLDFGVMDKIYLIYETPWWDVKVKGFQLVWSNDVSEESKQYWGRYLTGFDVILKNKPVLLGWVGGEGAKIVEQIPEEEVGRQATEILRRFTRNQEIPLPKKVIRTQWWSNEYIRGAYCHITVKCDESGICCSNLAQPVYSTVHANTESFKKPTILLAGESAHKNHFSTVHGAFESGESQAQVILDYMQSSS